MKSANAMAAPSEEILEEVVNVADNPGAGKTVSFYKSVIKPVVGWLVCIEGEEFGKSFELHSGQNFIGRSPRMDIILSDNSVSREKHARIVYEPNSRQFYAAPGDGGELAYVGGEILLAGTMIESGEIIKVGNTVLTLVPLCGPNFDWSDFE